MMKVTDLKRNDLKVNDVMWCELINEVEIVKASENVLIMNMYNGHVFLD
jgi:hypothetical protein